jgi:eukaryotic-like serine/threonine-protein kinase
MDPSASKPSPAASDPEATLDSSISGLASSPNESLPGQLRAIGPYQLLRLLGEGGMGQVWLAEQTSPVRRMVALKLIRVGLYDSVVLRRFESERQSLAIMEHPAIARVFDAGATPDGQPYFVMEYVPGVPITSYCDEKRLGIRERLELFIQVCEGVQHAHQKAIMHRDLKPANILVAEVDGKPVPRIIDFGLAKAASALETGGTMLTRAGGFVGTPGYMSPEQASATQDVDTRTDVYSLGVVLYELLTGSLPLGDMDYQRPLHEIFRKLHEVDPPRPSAKLSDSEKEVSGSQAQLRGTDARQLKAQLTGDLDCITLKALEKDRARRYATPLELAAEIQRYLFNEPILARPASTLYRARKYARRHRVGVAVAAIGALLLIGFALMQAVQLRRVQRERDRADRITRFMTDMFKVSDPDQARGNTITAREVLDRASAQIDKEMASDPDAQAQLMQVMSGVYSNLGLHPQAESLGRRAVDIRTRALGPDNPDTLESKMKLGWELLVLDRVAEAEKIEREAYDTARRTLPESNPLRARTASDLAGILANQSHFREAEKLAREGFELDRRNLPPNSWILLSAETELGEILSDQGRLAEAEPLYRDAANRGRAAFGEDSLQTMAWEMQLALVLTVEGRFAESETLLRHNLAVKRRVLGPDHPSTLATINELGFDLFQQGRYAEAEPILYSGLEHAEKAIGAESRMALDLRRTLSWDLNRLGRFQEAEKLQQQSLAAEIKISGAESPRALEVMEALAGTLKRSGRLQQAIEMDRQVVAIEVRRFGIDTRQASVTAYNLACYLALARQKDEAFAYLNQSIDHRLQPVTELAIEQDGDLNSLHSDPRWPALVAKAKEKAAEQKARP